MHLRKGDVIKRPGPLGTDHIGLFAGSDSTGRGWVLHNAKDDRVRRELLETFAAGETVSVVRRAANTLEGEVIIARGQSLLGQKFDLINFNCEHFVTVAISGRPISPQLRGVAFGIALLAGLGLLAKSFS